MEVKFTNVSFVYNEDTPLSNVALKNISTTFEENKIHGVIGKSGSGKTTMIELMSILLLPSKGKIEIGSKVISRRRKIDNINLLRHKIGCVFQFPEEQFFAKTVKKEIEFGLNFFNKSKESIDKHVNDALQMVGLDESYLERNPFLLSSGEMRRVAIASILASNPKIIILDEPTVGLDNKNKENLVKIIRLLKTRYNKTIIIVSHDSDLIHKISDNVVVMHKGEIVLTGSKYDVFTSDKLEEYELKVPKIIEFEKLVLKKKNVKLGYRDDINDLMKDVYRCVK